MAKREFDPTNRASAWINEGFLENDSQPVVRIKMNVDGEDKELSLFLNERHDAHGDLVELLQELAEIVVDTESSSPILTGKVDIPYAQRKAQGEGGGKRRGSRRTSGGGTRGSKPKGGEQTDDGDTW